MLTVGSPVPPGLILPTDTGAVPVSSLRGRKFLLFFFPKANTPGCSMEAKGFRDVHPAIVAKGVTVYGVSKDSPALQARWKAKEGFPFSFISDDGTLCELFGSWREKTLYGRKFMGIARISVLVDEAGRVARIWDPVKAASHAAEVIAELNGPSPPR